MKRLYKRPTDLPHTERHDAIHVWLADKDNQLNVFQRYVPNSEYQIIRKENEYAMYGWGNKYLVGYIDSLIFVNTSRLGWTIFLCEFKPDLVRLSETLGQIRTYRDHVKKMWQEYRNLYTILFTFDKNTRYDNVLKESGILVYRIDEN